MINGRDISGILQHWRTTFYIFWAHQIWNNSGLHIILSEALLGLVTRINTKRGNCAVFQMLKIKLKKQLTVTSREMFSHLWRHQVSFSSACNRGKWWGWQTVGRSWQTLRERTQQVAPVVGQERDGNVFFRREKKNINRQNNSGEKCEILENLPWTLVNMSKYTRETCCLTFKCGAGVTSRWALANRPGAREASRD